MYGFNWIDLIIVIVFIFYAIEGYSLGFFASLLDLLTFILSFVLALKLYIYPGKILVKSFSMPQGFSNAIGFFLIAMISEIIVGFLIKKIFTFNPVIFKTLNRILGILPGVLSGVVLISFLLTLAVSLPLSPYLKHSISSSKIGNILIVKTQRFEKDINNIFGGAVNETLNFLTVEPGNREMVNLNFKTGNLSIDSTGEEEMLVLVNQERRSRRFATLMSNKKLKDVARNHCSDMLKRGYFSHYTKEGASPFDRMSKAGISFVFAGENLALSPNVTVAMQGLMGSEGHKANILSPDFGKVGIGVIDGGIYGEMFCQEFTD